MSGLPSEETLGASKKGRCLRGQRGELCFFLHYKEIKRRGKAVANNGVRYRGGERNQKLNRTNQPIKTFSGKSKLTRVQEVDRIYRGALQVLGS